MVWTMKAVGVLTLIISCLYSFVTFMNIDSDPILDTDILLASAQKQLVATVLFLGTFSGFVLFGLSRIIEILEDKFGTE